MDFPLIFEHEDPLHRVRELLDNDQPTSNLPPGPFATFGVVEEFCLPGISVDGVGPVSLPLLEGEAEKLASISQRARISYGDDEECEAVLDESVWKSWEVEATKVHFLNDKWASWLDGIIDRAAMELGVKDGSQKIHAEFQKILLFGKGDMIMEHKTYPDVLREIEPVKEGYRWVLVYNLMDNRRSQVCYLTSFDLEFARIKKRIIKRQGLESGPSGLTSHLDYGYIRSALNLNYLNGNDLPRAKHFAQSCAEHGGFVVLLANLELFPMDEMQPSDKLNPALVFIMDYVRDSNHQETLENDKDEDENILFLDKLVLSKDSASLEGGRYGGHLDSEMILVPNKTLASFIDGELRGWDNHMSLVKKLQTRVKEKSDPSSEELLVQLCQYFLSHANPLDGRFYDVFLGLAASTAVFLRKPDTFREAVQKTSVRFSSGSYYDIGASIRFNPHTVKEDDLVEALTKAGELRWVYLNLTSFLKGFREERAVLENWIPSEHMERWTATILFQSLETLTANAADVSSIIKIMQERVVNGGFQGFIIYQGVKNLVLRSSQDGMFITSLVMHILTHPPDTIHQTHFKDLVQRVLKDTVSNFELQAFVKYTCEDHLGTGPINLLYNAAYVRDKDMSLNLLAKIQEQASKLTQKEINDFLPDFLEKLIAVMDCSSPKAQEFVQVLLTSYIVRSLRREPDLLKDSMYQGCTDQACSICPDVKEFLIDFNLTSRVVESRVYNHVLRNLKEHGGVSTIDEGKKVVLTKTLLWWGGGYKGWKNDADTVRNRILRFRHDKLKEALADKYDYIMKFRMLKFRGVFDDIKTSPNAQDLDQTGSSVAKE